MDRAVVVAVVAVRMVQVAVNEIVNVIAVRYLRMAAVWAVDVARSVTVCQVNAAVGIRRRHFEYALVDVVAVRMMQVTVVQIVDMTIVFDCQVTAARTMLMLMLFDFHTGSHNRCSLWKTLTKNEARSHPADSLPPIWQSGILLAPLPQIAGSESLSRYPVLAIPADFLASESKSMATACWTNRGISF